MDELVEEVQQYELGACGWSFVLVQRGRGVACE